MGDLIEESKAVLNLLFKAKMKVRNSSSMSLEDKSASIINFEKEERKWKKIINEMEIHESMKSINESANDTIAG